MKLNRIVKKLHKNLRHFGSLLFVIAVIAIGIIKLADQAPIAEGSTANIPVGSSPASEVLKQLEVKGRAPKTGYSRALFSTGWGNLGNCDLRNYILKRDLSQVTLVGSTCKVNSGILNDPYTGNVVNFTRGAETSALVQIDHVVALGDAWQKGAQTLSSSERYALANDPLELLAVDGASNQNKGDSDAASWLPSNKAYRCEYVARQIAVKQKYRLWVTMAEYQAMAKVLTACPDQELPS